MAFFENLGATLGSGAKAVADKTKELSNIASIKAQISTAEASLGKLYKDLGKAYYEDNKDSALYCDKKKAIADALEKIETLKQKLNDTQGTVKCPACGTDVSKDNAFCPQCGAATSTDTEVIVEPSEEE